MSEYFAHAIHGDDCAALMQASPRISERFKRVSRTYKNHMRMGSVLRMGRTIFPAVLKTFRENTVDLPEEAADKRLALGLSQLSHRAVDSYFKPVYRQLAPEYYENKFAESPSDIRILHDTVIYSIRKNLPHAEGDPLYDRDLFRHLVLLTPEQTAQDARYLEQIVGGYMVQDLLDLHDLPDQSAETLPRLQAYIMALDPVYIDTSRYADAIAQPYLDHIQRYIIDPNFYSREDPMIKLAVDIHEGADPDPERLEVALAQTGSLSQWGESLVWGVQFFEAAQRYLDGEIDYPELAEATMLT